MCQRQRELLREFINLISSIYLHVRVIWMNIKTESSSKSWNESITLLSTRIFGLFGYINPLQLHQVYKVKKNNNTNQGKSSCLRAIVEQNIIWSSLVLRPFLTSRGGEVRTEKIWERDKSVRQNKTNPLFAMNITVFTAFALSETNFQDFSKFQIDFSRTLKLTLPL